MPRNFSRLRKVQRLLTADDPFDAVNVGVRVEENTVRDFPVSACPARLLIVTFHRFGQTGVDDVAHVRFVDAHPEGDGGTDDLSGQTEP